tara:strand:+ start:153 stop:353 length:201 start_codon:yes stop_codon:yes gene_type:complete
MPLTKPEASPPVGGKLLVALYPEPPDTENEVPRTEGEWDGAIPGILYIVIYKVLPDNYMWGISSGN